TRRGPVTMYPPPSLQRGVNQVDEAPHVRVLPAGPPLVHRVPEGDSRVRVGKSERAAGAEVPEGSRARAETSLGHRELKSEPETRGPPQHHVLAIHLLDDCPRDDVR